MDSIASTYHNLLFNFHTSSDFLIVWFVTRDTGLWRNNHLDFIVVVYTADSKFDDFSDADIDSLIDDAVSLGNICIER